MAENGTREIVLLGQNVNAYHGAGPDDAVWGLARLIRAVAEIDCVVRIRYTTSHPRDMDDDLIAAHGDVPALMPFLHLPVQSGSDSILEAMNRKHTSDDYRRIIDRLRAARPDIAFSSDFIVGFPGERDQDFEDTMRLVRDVGYASAYSFKYSARPGTPAAVMKNLVQDKIATERLARLQALIVEQQTAYNQSFIGRRVAVLIDKPGKRVGQIQGKSPYGQSVNFDGNERLIGQVMDVDIVNAFDNSLRGVLPIGESVAA